MFGTHFKGRRVHRPLTWPCSTLSVVRAGFGAARNPALPLYDISKDRVADGDEVEWNILVGNSWRLVLGEFLSNFGILGGRSAGLGQRKCCGVSGEESDIISESYSPWSQLYLLQGLASPWSKLCQVAF